MQRQFSSFQRFWGRKWSLVRYYESTRHSNMSKVSLPWNSFNDENFPSISNSKINNNKPTNGCETRRSCRNCFYRLVHSRHMHFYVDQIKVLFFHSMKDINVDYTLVNKHPKARFIFFLDSFRPWLWDSKLFGLKFGGWGTSSSSTSLFLGNKFGDV